MAVHGNIWGNSAYSENHPAVSVDGGHGSGVPARHNVEGLPSLGDSFDMSVDSLGPTGKKFTEHLHSRKGNGKFEPSSLKGKKDEE